MIKHLQNRTRGAISVLVFQVHAGPSDASPKFMESVWSKVT